MRKPLPLTLAQPVLIVALMLAIIGLQGSASARPKPAPKQTKSASVAAADPSGTGNKVTVTAIRHWSSADVTHVAIDLGGPVKYKFAHLIEPERLYFDLQDVQVPPEVLAKRLREQDGFLTNIRVGKLDKTSTRFALDLDQPVEYSVSLVPDPYRLEVTFHRVPANRHKQKPREAQVLPPVIATVDTPKVVGSENSPGVQLTQVTPAAAQQAFANAHEAKPDGNGERSLIRALGLKIGKIVIDPGHGGDDHGTMGAAGVYEKDVVLDVALRLGKLLQDLGAEVIYTRANDRYLPLEARTAIANRENADLFVSIHANSSPDRDARGVETYYLNFTTSPEALEVAARENTVSRRPVSELRDLVQKIAQQNRIAESHEFADDVQNSLARELSNERNRGVREAPFIVLTGANMPAVLTEISFISNSEDESRLKDPAFREKIARALYDGISTYVNGLSGVASPSQSPAALASTVPPTPARHFAALPVAETSETRAPVGWSTLLLAFIASNRPFIVIFFLLAAAWSFFLTAPAPGQPLPALADAGAASPDSLETTVSPAAGAYSRLVKMRFLRRF